MSFLIKKILTKVSKIFSLIYIRICLIYDKRKRYSENKVLIILSGHIGDILLDAGAWISLEKYYKKQNRKVYFTGLMQCWKIFQMISGYSDDHYVVTNNNIDANKHPFLGVVMSLKAIRKYEFDKVITTIPEYDYYSCFMGVAVKANEHWGIFSRDAKKGIRSLSGKYNYSLIVPSEWNQRERTKALVHKLGDTAYLSRITPIPEINKQIDLIDICGKYLVVSVDSSNSNRCWLHNNFIELINRLLKETDYNIALTGTKISECNEYSNAFKDNERVKILIGKTSLPEWIEIIRNSSLLVGCDSGSVHVAASVGTPSICLTGVWDGYRIMPYVIDRNEKNTVAPVCVYRQDVNVKTLPCFNCVQTGSIGKNSECYLASKMGAPVLCMQKIKVEDVMNAIKMVNKDYIVSNNLT